jgi:hypothetical protein
MDQFTFQQIELFLQRQYQVYVPAVVFEYVAEPKTKDFVGWDYDDLFDFFSHFGEIETLEIYGKLSVILFKSFFDANTAREFLQNGSNFKESEKNNFCARWYKMEDESIISEPMRDRLNKFAQTNGMCMNGMNMMNAKKGPINSMNYPQYEMYNPYSMGQPYYGNMPGSYMQNGMNGMMHGGNMYMGQQMTASPGQFQSNHNSVQRKSSSNSGNSNIENSNTFNMGYDDKKQQSSNVTSSGKYTCRFEIQIENDKEFQVARRLIGAKGCNMKKNSGIMWKKSRWNFKPRCCKIETQRKGKWL